MLEEGFLKVSNLHQIYYSIFGNKKGIPLLLIHGGPGSLSKEKHLFGIDLNKFYVILYDQRGCGKSIPNGELNQNTINDNIEDIAKLLNFLKINKTLIMASSWGSALSLVFSIKYPNRIYKMFLRSTFLARKIDSEWLFDKVKIIFPDLYDNFIKLIPNNKRTNISDYLFKKLEKTSFEEQQIITAHLINYENKLMNLFSLNNTLIKPDDIDEKNINSTKIFLHYEKNVYFLKDNFIIDNANKIKNISIIFYHGRYDLDCPIAGVYELHKKLRNSELVIVEYEGHSGNMLKELSVRDLNKFCL